MADRAETCIFLSIRKLSHWWIQAQVAFIHHYIQPQTPNTSLPFLSSQPLAMASSDIVSQLSQLSTNPNAQSRASGYNDTLQTILSSCTGPELSENLVTYVQSILSDSIGVIHSRPLLSAFVEQYRNLEDDTVKISAGNDLVRMLAPKIVSYEQQDTDIKFIFFLIFLNHQKYNR